MIKIPIFIICLQSVRYKMCKESQPKLETIFKDVHIYPAVESSLIKPNDNRLSAYAKYHIKYSLDLDEMHLSSMGAVGCYLSHQELWKKALKLNTPIIIIEDDVQIDINFMITAIQSIPNSADHAALIYLPWVGPADCNDLWCTPKKRDSVLGTQMYYITPRGASELLKQALPIVAPVDVYINYIASTNKNFKSVFYKHSYFPFYQPLIQEVHSTIGRHFSIKKIFMPESNIYYAIVAFGVIFVYIKPKLHSECICKSNQKTKKTAEYNKLVDV